MTDERLSDEQISQLTGQAPCFIHFHTDQSSGTSLPDQTGKEGKILTTDGNTADWTIGVSDIFAFAAAHG